MADGTVARMPEFVHQPAGWATFDRELAGRLLQSRMTRPCPCCGGSNWNLQEGVYGLVPLAAKTFSYITDPGTVAPLIAVECIGCALTLTFNAVNLRVLP